jgi:hypothetical protein
MRTQILYRAAVMVFVFLAGALASHYVGVRASAAAKPLAVQWDSDAQCTSKVPRAWGDYKGGSAQSGLAFQAPDGTLRFVTNIPCGNQPAVALKIVRTDNGK